MSTSTLSSAQILTPARTRVYLGTVGAVAPTTPTGPFPEHTEVGHTTADSLTFETSPEFEDFNSAQSDYTVKKFQTADGASVQVDLAQWNEANFKAIYGGGEVTLVSTDPAPPVYKFVPPRLGEHTEVSALVQVVEGGKHYLYVFPKAMQVEGVSQALNKGAAVTLPLRLDILGADDTDAWYLITDDPAFAPPA